MKFSKSVLRAFFCGLITMFLAMAAIGDLSASPCRQALDNMANAGKLSAKQIRALQREVPGFKRVVQFIGKSTREKTYGSYLLVATDRPYPSLVRLWYTAEEKTPRISWIPLFRLSSVQAFFDRRSDISDAALVVGVEKGRVNRLRIHALDDDSGFWDVNSLRLDAPGFNFESQVTLRSAPLAGTEDSRILVTLGKRSGASILSLVDTRFGQAVGTFEVPGKNISIRLDSRYQNQLTVSTDGVPTKEFDLKKVWSRAFDAPVGRRPMDPIEN